MPHLSFAVPKYRHHKRSGQAVVTIAGRDHYLGPHGTKVSKAEYDRLVGEWLAAGRPSATAKKEVVVTVSTVIAAWWKFAKDLFQKNGRSTGTRENYRPVLSLLRKLYGHTPAAEFGPLALKALRQELVKKGNSRRYVNENVHRIRKIFRWAASEQMIPASVPQALATVEGLHKGQTLAPDHGPVQSVSDEIVEKTLPHLPKVVADMVRLQRLTGARPGEICSLRPVDIDRTNAVWRYVPAEHKTEHHGHQRAIYIGPRGQKILRPYLTRDPESHCFTPSESESARRAEAHRRRVTPLSCGNRPGKKTKGRGLTRFRDRYNNAAYRRAVERGCEKAFGMPDHLRNTNRRSPDQEESQRRAAAAGWRKKYVWTPHQLRHTAATEIRRRYGLEAAQVALGHHRLNVTEVYAEKNQDLARKVAEDLG